MMNMKMFWLIYLTLLVAGQTLVMSFPLQNRALNTQTTAGSSEADQEFAEVIITLFRAYDFRKVQKTNCLDL